MSTSGRDRVAPMSAGAARLWALALWLSSSAVTLGAPAAMTALLFDAGGWAGVAGVALLVALLLASPVVMLAWMVHVAACAFVARRRRRSGPASSSLDGVFGAGLSLAIWIPLLVVGARALEVELTDGPALATNTGVVASALLLGAFNGACLGAIANRRARS